MLAVFENVLIISLMTNVSFQRRILQKFCFARFSLLATAPPFRQPSQVRCCLYFEISNQNFKKKKTKKNPEIAKAIV